VPNYVITNEAQYPIKPDHISTDHHFFDAFEHSETEVSARWIVEFCKKQGSWNAFTLEDLERFYHLTRPQNESFHFNRLIHPEMAYGRQERYKTGGGWIIEGDDGKLYITHDFVIRCFRSSPSIFAKEEKTEVSPL